MSRTFTWQPTPKPVSEGSFTLGIAAALANTYDREVEELEGMQFDDSHLRVLRGMQSMAGGEAADEIGELIDGIQKYGCVTIVIEH